MGHPATGGLDSFRLLLADTSMYIRQSQSRAKVLPGVVLVFCCGSLLFAQDHKRERVCDFSDLKPARETHFAVRNLVFKLLPVYPSEALKERISGTVNVSIVIDRKGLVNRACALNGPAALRGAAEAAALKFRFKPNFGRRPASLGTTLYRQDVLVFDFKIARARNSQVRGKVFVR